MNVTIQPSSGGTPIILCVGGKVSPEGLSISGRSKTQVSEFFRGTSVKAYDRGNISTTISFSLTVPHASDSASEKYILVMHTVIAGGGTIIFTTEAGSVGSYQCQMLYSDLSSVDSTQIGTTTRHHFTIVGGLLTSSGKVPTLQSITNI